MSIRKIIAVCAAALIIAACEQPANSPPESENSLPESNFVAVTDITGVPTGGVKDTVIDLSKAAVQPPNATNKIIAWSGVTVTDSRFTPQSSGELTLTATVANGTAQGNFTKTFTLTITNALIPVENITGVPAAGVAGTPIDLSGATVVPENATNKTIIWEKKSGGYIEIAGASATSAAPGTIILTASIAQGTASGAYTQDFSITVSPRSVTPPPATLTGIQIKTQPDIIVYAKAQPFDPAGLVVEGIYSDETIKDLRLEEYTLSAVDTSIPGAKMVTVTAGTFTAQFAIMVNNSDKILQSIRLDSPPSKTVYEFGEQLNFAGMRITSTYSDGSTKQEMVYAYSGYDRTLRGTQTITVTINRKPVSFNVTVQIPASATVTANGYQEVTRSHQEYYKQVYYKGQTIGALPERLKVTVTANGVTGILTAERGISSADITGFSTAQTGARSPTLTLDAKTIALEIYVADVAPEVYFDYGYRRYTDKPNGAAPNGTAGYTVPAGRSLVITPTLFLMGENPPYFWTADPALNSVQSGAGNKYLTVRPAATGTYNVSVTVNGITASTTVVCTAALPASPPAEAGEGVIKHFAPGQFSVGGTGYGWSLGTQGGYEIWKLRRINDGTKNIRITGNPMASWSEPGIVWVSIDANGNGYPDDTWYELKGSDDEQSGYKSLITREYSLRYLRSSGLETPNEYGQYIGRVFWVDGKGRTGILPGGWPVTSAWGIPGSWATFTGTLLRDNGRIDTGDYNDVATGYGGWGYVDTAASTATAADNTWDKFSIADAIQRDGAPANLPWIDFVKVQTGVFRYAGVFGEVSTEIASADGLGSQTDFPMPD